MEDTVLIKEQQNDHPVYSEATRNRLRRIEGQVRGILSMMSNQTNCNDVVTQLSAVRAALDKLVVQVVAADLTDELRAKLMQNEDVEPLIRDALGRMTKMR